MLPLIERKQNLCIAVKTGKLEVKVQRWITASLGLGLNLIHVTRDAHCHNRETLKWGRATVTTGEKMSKRKQFSKMHIKKRRVLFRMRRSYINIILFILVSLVKRE